MRFSEVTEAFVSGERASYGNYASTGRSLYLFGNEIARHMPDGIAFTLAGWNSRTTRKAVNLLEGVAVSTKNYTPTNHDSVISSDKWYYARDGSECPFIEGHV